MTQNSTLEIKTYKTSRNLSLTILVIALVAYVILLAGWFTSLVNYLQLNNPKATLDDLDGWCKIMYMFSSYTIIVLVFGIVSLSVLLYIYMIRKNLIKGIYTASCIVIWIISLMLIAVSIANTFIKRPFNDTTVIAIFCSVLVGYVLVITFAAIMFAKLNLKLNSFKK